MTSSISRLFTFVISTFAQSSGFSWTTVVQPMMNWSPERRIIESSINTWATCLCRQSRCSGLQHASLDPLAHHMFWKEDWSEVLHWYSLVCYPQTDGCGTHARLSQSCDGSWDHDPPISLLLQVDHTWHQAIALQHTHSLGRHDSAGARSRPGSEA